jgi:Skp family chaperone for outer membrane proteins
VKKRLFSLLATLAFGVAILMTARTTAQQPAAPAVSQPTTKIAVLNLSYVVKNYTKYIAFTNEMKKQMETYDGRVKGKKASLEALAKSVKPEMTAPQREQLEKEVKQIQRELEDISNEGKKFLGQKSDEQLVILYREVQAVAQRYAQARGFEMVLHFNDAMASTPEYYSPGNIARKMQAGALMPLYVHPGMDISPLVVQTLNAGHKNEMDKINGGAPTTGQPAGGR